MDILRPVLSIIFADQPTGTGFSYSSNPSDLQHKEAGYYDIRKKCEGSLCYDFSTVETFLNEKSVREALRVGYIEFVSCSSQVHIAMTSDLMKNLVVGIPALLEDGIRVLIYESCSLKNPHMMIWYSDSALDCGRLRSSSMNASKFFSKIRTFAHIFVSCRWEIALAMHVFYL
ncbi:hypothetical protein CRG98_027609 [Punica granatum]|uniref:Uncharacterized protein n=1 Tax=Punica granatum TaxID=22663 RepID=A0A2I0J6U5_PUNGR|nr:hypothetical protein CRG98_027609 [Punica granatum]